MNFIVRNSANVANKYIRFAKWKIHKMNRKYGNILYSEIYVKQASARPEVYDVTVKLGVPGPDIIIKSKSGNLRSLLSDISAKMKRQLRTYTDK